MNHLLSYQEFSVSIRACLESFLLPDLEMTDLRRRRRGGRMKDAFHITKEGEPFGRIVYTEDLYQQYLQGSEPEEIAGSVAEMCREGMPEGITDIFDYEKMKNRLTLRLVNFEKNREMLEDVIYRRFLDLALTCRMICPADESVLRTAVVTHSLLDHWGVSEEEVLSQAVNCTRRREPAVLRPLRDILTELAPETSENPPGESDLYVLTTRTGISGACAVITSACVEILAERLERDILILPSSVHEMLLLPDSGKWETEALQKIVSDINRNVVSEEDYLSDHIYRYRFADHEFVIEEETAQVHVIPG